MSSILKALKRVEESGPVEDGASRTLPPRDAPSPLRSFRRWRPETWFAGGTRIRWLLSALVLAGAAAAYYWWTGHTAAPTAPETAKEVRASLPPRPADPAPPAAAPPERTVQPRAVRPPVPATEPPAAASQAAPQVNPALPIQAPPPTSRVRPREGPAGPPAEMRPSPAKSPAPPLERTDAARPAAPRTAEDGLSRLDESKLKVMAIAWAAEPARRLAVVNGHIVREGETVEGFSVTQIRRDDIIVNEGGRSWRVELNLKSQP